MIKPQFNPKLLEGEDYLDLINKNLVSGGPSKDGIPAIDKPKYVTAEEADKILSSDEKIFGIDHNGKVLAFPRSIMYWHEIVNEIVDGEKISITYCPLTETVIGYKNKNLGVSGRLYNSNLVVYDRETDSEIPQILGTAINGPLKGQKLETLHVYVTTWKKWKEKYPNTLVLSRDTGFHRDYDRNPYPGYDQILRIWFPLAAESDLFSTKKMIHAISLNNEYLAIPKDEFKEIKEKEYTLGGEEIKIIYDERLGVINVFEGNEQLNSFDSYWFAWYAYHPDTRVLKI